MRLFKTKSKPQSEATPAAPAQDPLLAVPLRVEGVTTELSASKQVRLRRVLPAKGRMGRWCAARLGWERVQHIELDPQGSAFWQKIDGKRALHEIAGELSGDSGRDWREAVLQFTRDLMFRNLIQLKVEGAPHE